MLEIECKDWQPLETEFRSSSAKATTCRRIGHQLSRSIPVSTLHRSSLQSAKYLRQVDITAGSASFQFIDSIEELAAALILECIITKNAGGLHGTVVLWVHRSFSVQRGIHNDKPYRRADGDQDQYIPGGRPIRCTLRSRLEAESSGTVRRMQTSRCCTA